MQVSEPPNFPLLNALDRILKFFAIVVGGSILLGMTLLSFVNVIIMRKALNNPIFGAEDVLVLGLVMIVAISIPYGARSGAHIEIELLESRMSPKFDKSSRLLMNVLGVAILALLSWRLWHAGASAARFGETSQQLLVPFGPFYYILSVFVGLYVAVLILESWQLTKHNRVSRIDL